MRGRQCRTQTGILHTDFDSERFLRIVRQLADFSREKAKQVADGVVQHHDTENQQPALNNFAFARADDRTDNQHNGNHRNQRQGSGSAFGLFAEHSMCNHAERDGQQHHLNNGNKHRLRIDVEHFTCQKQENSRRQQRSQ